jgi:hypothetical protein
MLKLAVRLLAVGSALTAVACAPTAEANDPVVPSGAHVETLQTLRLVVHGTAAARPTASCNSAPSSPPVYVRINDEISGDFTLRPTKGVAVLHVQELSTSKTWCAMTRDDGTGAVIQDLFPGGIFAISVDGEATRGSAAPTPFEVVVERL